MLSLSGQIIEMLLEFGKSGYTEAIFAKFYRVDDKGLKELFHEFLDNSFFYF